MLTFPSKAAVGKILPKEAFYKRLTLNSEVRDKFVSDVKHIVLEYKLAQETLNVEKGQDVSEILVLSIDLKRQDMDYRIIESIARQNAHKLIFHLKYHEQGQLALYFNKLYKTGWMPIESLFLEVKGINIDRIWEGFIEQIALKEEEVATNESLTVEDKLKRQETILKLQKEIEKFERLSRKEKQPKKRFELFTKLQGLQKKLAEEKGE